MLFIVLGMLMVVVALANIILNIISSQSRLTHHQASRIQAYYAAWAGMNYAIEKLRVGDTNWIPSPDTGTNTRVRTLCRSGCDVNEPDLPTSIQQVSITVYAAGTGISGTRKLTVTTDYTYTP